MDPIAVLMQEHRVIEGVLDALGRFASAPADTPAARERLRDFTVFFREFADTRHHGKEEDILFAVMIEQGFPREQGPLAVMLAEHDQGRELVGTLATLADQASPWTETDRSLLRRAAFAFADLLGQHIEKEDQILYPMAQARLPGEAMAEVARRVEARMQEDERGGTTRRLRELADDLTGSGEGGRA